MKITHKVKIHPPKSGHSTSKLINFPWKRLVLQNMVIYELFAKSRESPVLGKPPLGVRRLGVRKMSIALWHFHVDGFPQLNVFRWIIHSAPPRHFQHPAAVTRFQRANFQMVSTRSLISNPPLLFQDKLFEKCLIANLARILS